MNFKGEIRIEGSEHGSTIDPIDIPCPVDKVRELQTMYAAAPDLLAFAERMVQYFKDNPSGYVDMLEQGAAAIAKAKGAS